MTLQPPYVFVTSPRPLLAYKAADKHNYCLRRRSNERNRLWKFIHPPPKKVNVRLELSQRSKSDEVSACLIICANKKHLLYEKVRSCKKSEKGPTLIKLRLQLTTLFTVD